MRTRRSRVYGASLTRLEGMEPRRLLAGIDPSAAILTAMPAAPDHLAAAVTSPAASASETTPSAVVAASSTGTASTSPKSQKLFSGGSVYDVTIAGPGKVIASMGPSGARILAIGTGPDSQISIARAKATHASRGAAFQIGRLTVRSQQLGDLIAGGTVLNGPTSGLTGAVHSVSLASISRRGWLDVGSLGSLNVGAILGVATIAGPVSSIDAGPVSGSLESVGPAGAVVIDSVAGSLFLDSSASSLATGPVAGRVAVDGDAGEVSAGAVTGSLTIGGNLSTANVGPIASAGVFSVSGNAGNLTFGDVEGRIGLGRDLNSLRAGSVSGSISVAGGINSSLTTGPVAGTIAVGGPAQIVNVGGVGGTVTVVGPVGALSAQGVDGTLTLDGSASSLSLGSVGGSIQVGGSVASLTTGAVSGQVQLASSLATANFGAISLAAGHAVHVAGDVTGAIAIDSATLAGGTITLDRDADGPIRVVGSLSTSGGGRLVVGRDASGLEVDGNLDASAGSGVTIGRNLAAMNVVGDLDTTTGGQVAVAGNLGSLTVQGVIVGHLDEDLVVGLNLGALNVRGGRPGLGGIESADLDVGKNIQGVDIAQGVFGSRITAGVLIDGGSPADGYNIGPDGPVAVFDSTITAGVRIVNFTISGDVKSDKPANPSGGFTRIVAGVDRAGNYAIGGSIDHFQILGSLIDSVVAASVKPHGGDGTVTTSPGNAPGDGGNDTYDAPAGTITGSVGTPVSVGPGVGNFLTETVPNFTAPPFDSAIDPTIDDAVLPGSINASFAPSLATNPTPFPTESTVLGGVISTRHGDEADYAGIFAADTRGVFVGVSPR